MLYIAVNSVEQSLETGDDTERGRWKDKYWVPI